MTVINISDSEDASAPDSWLYYFAIAGFLIIILICARLFFYSTQSTQVQEGQKLHP
jgi:hypothetical protein